MICYLQVSRSGDAVGVMNVSASNGTTGMTGADDAFSARSLLVPVADSFFQFESTERDISRPHHMSDQVVKSQIASHPLYPNMVSAYIECQKVGAPPELAMLLEEIGRENHPIAMSSCNDQMGDDPELDEFMESYCEILQRYKEELSRPFNEATSFLSSMESQLSSLCKETLTISLDYRSGNAAAGTSEEESSFGEVDVTDCNDESTTRTADQEIKEMLLHKYSGYLSNLRKEFIKKRKKGKLPKDARTMLLNWWNTHYRWPYPTEEEKLKLSELSGLDHKQINNWFINQRKRHWKPSDDMKYALLENVSFGNHGSHFCLDIESGSHETDDI